MRKVQQLVLKVLFILKYFSSVNEKVNVAQLYPTLCDPMDYTVNGILQTRILEWIAVSFSRNLPNPGIKLWSPALQVDPLPAELPEKPSVNEI